MLLLLLLRNRLPAFSSATVDQRKTRIPAPGTNQATLFAPPDGKQYDDEDGRK